MLDYDEIGRILLFYLPFQRAEAVLEEIQRLVELGDHPGQACLYALKDVAGHGPILAQEPIKHWVDEWSVQQTAWNEKARAWVEANAQVVAAEPGRVFRLENATISRLDDQTDHYNVSASATCPSLGPNTPGIRLSKWHGPGSNNLTVLSRADALALMEALALGLLLLERVKP